MRESVLQSGQVDAVFATYSITPFRQEVISFAGPYYTSRQAVLVKAGNTAVTGIDSLAGKLVATQSGSTGPAILAEYAPEAVVQEFATDIEARTALEQGRVDAYVTDYTLPYLRLVWSYYACVLIATSLIPAAFCSESLMAGMNTIAVGQIEAAHSLGMTFFQTLKNVVLPQALRSVVLPMTNLLVATMLTTALASQVPLNPAGPDRPRLLHHHARRGRGDGGPSRLRYRPAADARQDQQEPRRPGRQHGAD